MIYNDDNYSKESHLGIEQMYVENDRFRKYYDDIEEMAAEFLYETLKIYCKSILKEHPKIGCFLIKY